MEVVFLKTLWRTLSKPLLMCSTAFSRYYSLLCQFWVRLQPSSIYACFFFYLHLMLSPYRKLPITFFTPIQDRGWYMISTSNISIFLVAFSGRYFIYFWFSIYLNFVPCNGESYTVLLVLLLSGWNPLKLVYKLCWLFWRFELFYNLMAWPKHLIS